MSRSQYAARMHAQRSMSDTLEQVAPETVEAPTAPPGRALEVGAADDHAERQADAIAEQVLGRLADQHEHAPGCGHDGGTAVRRAPAATAGAIGAAGGALDGDSTAAIESARGGGSALDAGVRREMEAGFGRSLGDVRIHTDSRADQLSRQMSARAFTTGKDVFFARGEYDPTSASGRHTLAHELAHTVQDGGAARRKMRGTAEALVSQGEVGKDRGKSSGFLRKLVGKLTHWDRIVAGVRAYEAEESKLLAGGKNPDAITLMSAKPGMLRLLTKVQGAVKDWRKSNDSDGQDVAFEGRRRQAQDNVESDTRTKAGRRQAVGLLEPRIGNEVTLLSAPDSTAWMSSLGLSSAQGTETGRRAGGQMNQVTEVAYQTESGDLTGFFKEDKGFNDRTLSQEEQVGIRQIDPNYGARSVALYRLDQLFNAKVTARAEFAVHQNGAGKSVLGTVLESAKGKSGSSYNYGVDQKQAASARAGGKETLALDDPVLQRGLNKLQLLDAISGQLDRHMGNYYVEADDQGNALGVTGIDLDMAFGSTMTTVDRSAAPDAMNYKGLPEFIDEEMGLKILQVQPGDVRAALTGLLPKAEVEATVARFREVQTAVIEAQQSGRLRDRWGTSPVSEGSSYQQLGDDRHARPTYLDEAKAGTRWDLNEDIYKTSRAAAQKMVDERDWEDLPIEVPRALVSAFGSFWKGTLEGPLTPVAETLWNTKAPEQIPTVVVAVVKEAMDRSDVNRVWVDVQEGLGQPADAAGAAMTKRIEQIVAAVLPKLRAAPAKKSGPGRG